MQFQILQKVSWENVTVSIFFNIGKSHHIFITIYNDTNIDTILATQNVTSKILIYNSNQTSQPSTENEPKSISITNLYPNNLDRLHSEDRFLTEISQLTRQIIKRLEVVAIIKCEWERNETSIMNKPLFYYFNTYDLIFQYMRNNSRNSREYNERIRLFCKEIRNGNTECKKFSFKFSWILVQREMYGFEEVIVIFIDFDTSFKMWVYRRFELLISWSIF